jgi:hypothetical protein
MNPKVGKSHKHGRVFEAVVFDADDRNKVIYQSGLGFNARGKANCQQWIDALALPKTLCDHSGDQSAA